MNSNGLFFAIDQSTSSTKAMLFTPDGKLLDEVFRQVVCKNFIGLIQFVLEVFIEQFQVKFVGHNIVIEPCLCIDGLDIFFADVNGF